jgi:hypothetical protein
MQIYSVGERANTANKAVFLKGGAHTDKKENQIFLIENSEWSSCKVICEEGLPNIGGNAQIFNHI